MTVTEARRRLLEKARERGVDLEVLATRADSLRINSVDGRAGEIHNSSRGGVGLRVIKDGKVGYASTEELTEAALDWALDEAIENALLQAEGGAVLPAGRDLGSTDQLSEGLSAPLSQKAAAAHELERGLKADERVQVVQLAQFQQQVTEVEIGSTAGADGHFRTGAALLFTYMVMGDGKSMKQGMEVSGKPEFHQLDPGATAQESVRKLGRHLGARPLSTGRRRAVFEPGVVATLLRLLCYALSGKTLAEGKSRLAGKIGEQIASPLVTLIDDATLEGGMASRPFDSEGTPSRRLPLIENGVLRSFLHNTDTARRTGHETTGHGFRTYASTLGVDPTNLLLEPGAGIPQADGILVTDLMGFHAGANPITGDVSVQAMGLELVGGEQAPVDDFAVSFNLFDLLMRIDAVGDDQDWVLGYMGLAKVPSIAAPDVSFAGS